MAERLIYGLLRARVIDTVDFKETGKIRIRVIGVDPDDTWEDARIMTPFGGLPNMGIQFVPPIGAEGLVLFERGQERLPIWLGSIVSSYGQSTVEGWNTAVEAENPTDFIIKTQYTKVDSQDVDNNENKVENIIKMNENELTIAKVRQDSEYTYEKEGYSFTDKAYNTVKLSDEEIKIDFKFKDNDKSNSISVKENKVSMSFDTNAGEMFTEINEDSIELSAGGSNISISKNGDVSITTQGKVKLNGDSGSGVLYEALRDFVNQSYNKHSHGTPAGPSSPPTKPFTSSQSMQSKSVKLT